MRDTHCRPTPFRPENNSPSFRHWVHTYTPTLPGFHYKPFPKKRKPNLVLCHLLWYAVPITGNGGHHGAHFSPRSGLGDAVRTCLCSGSRTHAPDLTLLLRERDGIRSSLFQAVSAFCGSIFPSRWVCAFSPRAGCRRHTMPPSIPCGPLPWSWPPPPCECRPDAGPPEPPVPAAAGLDYHRRHLSAEGRTPAAHTVHEGPGSGILPAVTCPVLVLCDQRDWANRTAAGQLASARQENLPGSSPGAGHQLNLEAPQAAAEALSNFWNCPEPSRRKNTPDHGSGVFFSLERRPAHWAASAVSAAFAAAAFSAWAFLMALYFSFSSAVAAGRMASLGQTLVQSLQPTHFS